MLGSEKMIMRKLFRNFALVAVAAVGVVACSEAEIDELGENLEPVEATTVLFAATPSGEATTKVEFTDNNEDDDTETTGIDLKWELDDAFTLYDADGAKVGEFICTDAESGKFEAEGVTLTEGDEYTAKYNEDATTASQDGDKINNLDAACQMEATFKYSTEGTSITFEHKMAIMTFKFESAERPAKLVFDNGDEASYTVTYTELEPNESNIYTSHIMIEPCEAVSRTLTFSLYATADATDAYDIRSVPTSKAYVAGTRYTATTSSLDQIIWLGSGTEEEPYMISNEADLVALSTSVNNYNIHKDNYFKLTNDIELTSSFSSIGCSNGQYFSGVFDGCGFKISGLNIESEDSYQGLFGYTYDAIIRNLSVDGKVTGAYSVGGIIGNANGTHIVNCHSSIEVIGTSRYVGGVVGSASNTNDNYCYIIGCYFDGSVTTDYITGFCGGVVGCLNVGSAAYGCYSTIAIMGNNCGSVFGFVESTSLGYSGCYFNGDLDTKDNFAASLTTAEMKDGTLAKLLNNGLLNYSGDVWAFKMSEESEYPVIDFNGSIPTYSEPYWSGTGAEGDPYVIETADQLRALSSRVVSDGVSYMGVYFKLGEDIDLGGIDSDGATVAANKFTSIGNSSTSFCGSFDGDNHKIEGLYISSSYGQGLFGYVDSGFSLSNLSVYGSVSCSSNSGGIVGLTDNSAVTITNCHNYVDVSSSSTSVGGILGFDTSGSTISGCTNSGNIVSSTSYRSAYIGGIMGRTASASISNCHNYGDVTVSNGGGRIAGILGYAVYAASVTSCSNSGNIDGGSSSSYSSYIGGILGYGYYIACSDCYNTGSVKGYQYVAGIAGMCSTSTNCYNIGSVSGDSTKLYGVAYGISSFSNCYYLSGTTSDSKATEKSEAEMTGGTFSETLGSAYKEDYSGDASINNGYPILIWQ